MRIRFLTRFAAGLALAAGVAAAGEPAPLTDRELAWHVLSRLGYGPKPGDLERVLEMGVDRYIEAQLQPTGRTPADLQSRLQGLTTLNLSVSELADRYALDREERKAEKAEKKAGGEPDKKSAKQSKKAAKRRAKAEAKAQSGEEGEDAESMDSAEAQSGKDMDAESMDSMRDEKGKKTLDEMDSLRQLVAERAMARVIRAVHSPQQLDEVMVDFWFNHFNVFARKGKVMPYLIGLHEDQLRQHAMGKFEDLLLASAHSPAMLYYLDNWVSVDEEAATEMRKARENRRFRKSLSRTQRQDVNRYLKQAKGLNENYARELLELHTLGVDGGYTQSDVREVARCFTGWSLRRPEQGALFTFRDQFHDTGAKQVLGTAISAGGDESDGLRVLRLLARHPSTARHLSTKLAQRFVSDQPPAALVDAMSQRYLETDGDIREVLRTMFASPEFRSRTAYQAKVKTPLEFVVSALRAVDATVGPTSLFVLKSLHEMNQPLYLCQPPTGYSQTASSWTSAGAMLNRMNLATRLTNGRLSELGLRLPQTRDVTEIARQILGFDPVPAVLETIEETAQGRKSQQIAAALVLGGPDFQKR